tara:strand:- start:13120 stop:14190 length:1071 start_codon:yes stop_codon:yes gene_type:complete
MYTHIERIYNTVGRNLGMKDYSSHINSWVEWAFEAELLIGSKDTFEQVESTYSSTGAASSGTITFTDNPSYNDSITLNGVTLFFRNTPTGSVSLNQHGPANAVSIKSTLALTLVELSYKLNGNNVSNNTSAFIFSESLQGYTYVTDSTTLTITKKEVGIEGNNFTLESSNVNAICSSSHLTGGKGLLLNQQLRLPDNIVKLLGVRGGTGDSNFRHSELLQPIAVHRERVGKDSLDTQQKALRYYVSGNRINIQHDAITEITIVYSSYPTDAKGHPMIKDSHTTAVAQYIMWQQKNIDFINGKLSMYVVKELEKRWYFLCGKARGDDNMPTAEELKQIGKIWNTMVPVKNNRGLLDL